MFSNKLNVHAKTQHVEHSILFEHSEKTKFVEHSKKESTLNPINVHFVLHCQSDSWESFSFGTSRAHGALDKGSNIETSTVQKSKANAQTSKRQKC